MQATTIETDLCLEIDFYSRPQLVTLLETIGARNPGAVWSRQIERMGDEPVAEIYRINGLPVFEIVAQGGQRGFNDLRPGKATPLTLTVRA